MATRLTRKTVALGDGGPKRTEPGASYGDRRAMRARPGIPAPAPGACALRASYRHSASNSERNFSMYEMYGPIAPS